MKKTSFLAITLLVIIVSPFKGLSQTTEIELFVRPSFTPFLVLQDNRGIYEDYDGQLKLSFGGTVNVLLTSKSNLGISLLYDSRGIVDAIEFRDENNYIISTEGVKIVGDFLTLPVTWRWRTGNKIKWQFEAGLYASYQLREKMIYPFKIPTLIDGEIVETDVVKTPGVYKKADFGSVFGVSSYIPLNDKLSLLVGVNAIISGVNLGKITNDKAYSTSLGLNVGLSYKLGKATSD